MRTERLLLGSGGPGMHWAGNGLPVRSVLDYNGLGRELVQLCVNLRAGDNVAGHPKQ